jgi:hypothetical protein
MSRCITMVRNVQDVRCREIARLKKKVEHTRDNITVAGTLLRCLRLCGFINCYESNFNGIGLTRRTIVTKEIYHL